VEGVLVNEKENRREFTGRFGIRLATGGVEHQANHVGSKEQAGVRLDVAHA